MRMPNPGPNQAPHLREIPNDEPEESDGSCSTSSIDEDCVLEDLVRPGTAEYHTSTINGIVLNYFEKWGLETSYNTFWNECVTKEIPLPASISEPIFKQTNFTTQHAKRLMLCFDEMIGNELLEYWAMFENENEPGPLLLRTSMNIHIYVTSLPFQKNLDSDTKREVMEQLRAFLQQNSEELTNDEVCVPLFAFAFVTDPMTHPVFKVVFTKKWQAELRETLETMLDEHEETHSSTGPSSADLSRIYQNYVAEYGHADQQNPSRKYYRKPGRNLERTIKKAGRETVSLAKYQKAQDQITHMMEHGLMIKQTLLFCQGRYFKLLQSTNGLIRAWKNEVHGDSPESEELMRNIDKFADVLFSKEKGVEGNGDEPEGAGDNQPENGQDDTPTNSITTKPDSNKADLAGTDTDSNFSDMEMDEYTVDEGTDSEQLISGISMLYCPPPPKSSKQIPPQQPPPLSQPTAPKQPQPRSKLTVPGQAQPRSKPGASEELPPVRAGSVPLLSQPEELDPVEWHKRFHEGLLPADSVPNGLRDYMAHSHERELSYQGGRLPSSQNNPGSDNHRFDLSEPFPTPPRTYEVTPRSVKQMYIPASTQVGCSPKEKVKSSKASPGPAGQDFNRRSKSDAPRVPKPRVEEIKNMIRDLQQSPRNVKAKAAPPEEKQEPNRVPARTGEPIPPLKPIRARRHNPPPALPRNPDGTTALTTIVPGMPEVIIPKRVAGDAMRGCEKKSALLASIMGVMPPDASKCAPPNRGAVHGEPPAPKVPVKVLVGPKKGHAGGDGNPHGSPTGRNTKALAPFGSQSPSARAAFTLALNKHKADTTYKKTIAFGKTTTSPTPARRNNANPVAKPKSGDGVHKKSF